MNSALKHTLLSNRDDVNIRRSFWKISNKKCNMVSLKWLVDSERKVLMVIGFDHVQGEGKHGTRDHIVISLHMIAAMDM